MGISRVEDTHFPKKRHLRVKDKLIDLTIPKIMGIVNVTPDSFYSDSRIKTDKKLLSAVEGMLKDGADFIDIGGYSTRPNADFVSEEEELKRVIAPIKLIKKEFPDCILSLDTFRGNIAETGIEHGADMINDISGWQYDPKLLDVVAKHNLPYILMHVAEHAEKMHETTVNDHLFRDMIFYFSNKLQQLTDRGITDVIIDPGFGFSKTLEQNYELLSDLSLFSILERPLLVGFSRKSMIYKKLDIDPKDALNGTTILNTQALTKGASILRVHDVLEAKQIIRLLF
jgi:dihydropteroate synthase